MDRSASSWLRLLNNGDLPWMEGKASAGDLGWRDADEHALLRGDPGSKGKLFDTANLRGIGDHLSGSDSQDAPPRPQRQLHVIDFKSKCPTLPDGVELVAFTGTEDDGVPIHHEVHRQDQGAALRRRPPDTTNAHPGQQSKAGFP